MRSAYRNITIYLRSLRRSLNRVALFEATSVSVLSLVLGCLVALALAAVAGRAAGAVPLISGIAVAGWSVWYFWWRPRASRRTDDAMARWVEDRVEGLHSGVITAVQTERLIAGQADGSQIGASALGFSPALADASANQAAAALLHHPPGGLVLTRRLKHLALAALAVSLTMTAAVILRPAFVSEGWAAFTSPPIPADDPSLERLVDVAVGDFTLEITPPSYLRMETRKEVSTSGAIRAVKGSQVRYVATALEPSSGAVLVLESQPDARWGVSLAQGGVLEGKIGIGEDDRYQFVLTLDDGQVLRERVWRTIQAVPDGVPRVQLLLPQSDLEVHHGDEVPLLFEANDDFGLTQIELVVVAADGAEKLRKSVKQPQGGRTARGTTSLAMAELDLKPGDTVEAYFEATDTNTLSGPGRAQSAKRTLTMYSPEREHEALLTQLERLIDALVGIIADRMESPVEERRARRLFDYIETQRAISNKEALALTALRAIQVALRTDPLTDDTFRAALKTAFEALEGAHNQEASQIHKAVSPDIVTPRPPVLVQLLFAANVDATDAVEATIFELKRLLDKARQDKVLQQGRDMLEVQNELRELMEKIKGGDKEAVKDALGKIAELQAKLRRMQREMAKMAERVPYENQNMSSKPKGDQSEAKSMEDAMAEIERLMREGKIDEAMKRLEELNKQTQELMAGLQDDFKRVRVTQKGRQMMSEFQQQLSQVADGQRGLSSEAGQEQRKADEQRMAQQREALEAAKGDAKAIRDELRKIDKSALHRSDKEALKSLQSQAARLQKQLNHLDASGAQSSAGDVAKGAKALDKEVGEGAARETNAGKLGRLEGARKGLGKAGAAAQELARKLAKLGEGKPGGQGEGAKAGKDGRGTEGAKPGEGRGLRGVGKRQGKLARKLGGLQDSLEQLDKEMPGLRERLKSDLDRAKQSMEQAAKQLGDGKGRSARDRQDDAQERLDNAMKSLDKAMKQRRGNASGGSGVNDKKEKVEIPGEYNVPKEFREELLKAMKENAPENYKKRIDRYYKELTK